MLQNNNNKGFTLVEALVSMVILFLILIGLLSAMITSYKLSMRNQIRNEAVQIAKEKIDTFKTSLNPSLFKSKTCSQASDNDIVVRRFRNTNYTFYVVGNILDKGYLYEVEVAVCDKNKKEIYKTKTLVRK